MRQPLLLATSNPGKLEEFSHLLGADIDVVPLAGTTVVMPTVVMPEETGDTFAANAILKAVAAARQSGMVALADDSGLVVEDLEGRPGVRSARFAGETATAADNRLLLHRSLAERPDGSRSARFVCVVAVAQPNGDVWTETGTLEGLITSRERGESGFGYDPMFEVADGRTLAELTAGEKNAISHRGKALRAAQPRLRALLENQGDASRRSSEADGAAFVPS